MDGTRKTPPGREAQNQSRRDGIRAGSVSGPWRSVPKAGEAAGESGSATPLDWTGRGGATGRPEGDAAPADRSGPEPRDAVHHAEQGHRDAVPLRGTRGLAGWVVFGLGVAVALVAAAFYLGPDRTAPTGPVASVAGPEAEGAPASDAATVPAEEAAAGTEAADPVAASETGAVRLRVGPDADPAEIARVSEGLETGGVGPILVETLPFAITQSRVGYYRPEDEAAARALADLAGPLIGTDDIGLRDYGDLLSDTEPGRLDLWLGE